MFHRLTVVGIVGGDFFVLFCLFSLKRGDYTENWHLVFCANK